MQYEILPSVWGRPLHGIKFESLAEQFDEIAAKMGESTGHISLSDSEFVGRSFRNWKSVGEALSSEWREGMDIYDKMIAELRDAEMPKPRNIRRRRVYSEDGGDEVNIDLLRAGLPFWETTHRDARPGPLSVTIVVNMTTLASRNYREVLWRGVAAVCLTEILERSGYRVELWSADLVSVHSFNGCDDGFCCATTLKRGQETLDPSTIINAVSGWVHRTMNFGSFYLVPNKTPHHGFGRPQSMEKNVLNWITPDEQALAVDDVWNYNDAVAWVRKQLQQFINR